MYATVREAPLALDGAWWPRGRAAPTRPRRRGGRAHGTRGPSELARDFRRRCRRAKSRRRDAVDARIAPSASTASARSVGEARVVEAAARRRRCRRRRAGSGAPRGSLRGRARRPRGRCSATRWSPRRRGRGSTAVRRRRVATTRGVQRARQEVQRAAAGNRDPQRLVRHRGEIRSAGSRRAARRQRLHVGAPRASADGARVTVNSRIAPSDAGGTTSCAPEMRSSATIPSHALESDVVSPLRYASRSHDRR